MVVRTRFIMIDVKTRRFIFTGSRIRFTQKTPRGGIQAVFRIFATVSFVADVRYSIQALQNTVRMKLMRGAMMQPNRAKGAKKMMQKLKRVRMTPCTIPNVIRRAY